MNAHTHHIQPDELLDQLSKAIFDEAEALAAARADDLLDAVKRKEQLAQALEALDQDSRAGLDPIRLAELREANLSNAALMQVAQGHVIWALNQLGRVDSQPTYTPGGRKPMHTLRQHIGTA